MIARLHLNYHYIYQMIITREEIALLVKRCHYDLRKYFFSNRIINIWNSLPNSVVMADTVNQFKHRLDKYWKNYDFVYDHWTTYI